MDATPSVHFFGCEFGRASSEPEPIAQMSRFRLRTPRLPLRAALRPELYARITEKLVFNRLNYDVQMEIARLHIGRELAFLRDKGFDLTIGHSVVSFLMQRGFHSRLGARPLRDTIEKHLPARSRMPCLPELLRAVWNSLFPAPNWRCGPARSAR